MDFKQIQELIKMINKSNIGELTFEQKDFRITIKQKEDNIQVQAPAYNYPPQQVYAQQQQQNYQPSQSQQASSGAGADKSKTPDATSSNYVTIKSPMIGTFYRRPSPDKPIFVEVGDEVNPGKVVCIIEAMKLFNEIESEVKGRIVKVLAEDASPVEYDQPLFLVDPS